ncbi:NAD(+) diphosphatase [Nocardioides sp. GY 10127]|uniref:NAD(+) diphosphatase n=1 Tax=Nocardioides sp. GY 10127 TaxID=2569762 RepID=UPI0010A912E7|nr:NAD(+) diphosphatase [Nocardioides sp. GY 10127]TIC84184.1 NAD(+) diphosphatase [Nocardioides sp. GY 10127]
MTHPHEQLSAGAHDRLAEHRDDQAWLDDRWDDPSTGVIVLAGARLDRRPEGGVRWTTSAAAPEGERVLLGQAAGRTWFAVLTATDTEGQQDADWRSLRDLLSDVVSGAADGTVGVVDDGAAGGAADVAEPVPTPVLLHAVAVAEWRRAARFCPRCGSPLLMRRAGHELRCEANDHPQFPRLDPAVIMLVAHGEPGAEDERCLLGRQRVWPEGRYSTLAGFCEPGEPLEDAVRREVHEEAGVRVGEVAYFGNQPWPLPQSLMLGFRARAVTTDIALLDDELVDARWFTRAELAEHAALGTIVLPRGVSISRSLIEDWYGGALPGSW